MQMSFISIFHKTEKWSVNHSISMYTLLLSTTIKLCTITPGHPQPSYHGKTARDVFVKTVLEFRSRHALK